MKTETTEPLLTDEMIVRLANIRAIERGQDERERNEIRDSYVLGYLTCREIEIESHLATEKKKAAIEFAEWVIDNRYFHDNNEQRTHTASELYDKFLTEK